jgi:hypothetical protein
MSIEPFSQTSGLMTGLQTIGPKKANAQILEFKSKKEKEQEQKVIRWANEQFRFMREDRMRFEQQWYLNVAFYLGQQNVSIVRSQSSRQPGGFKLYTPPAPYYRSRPVINRIRPVIRSELSKLTSQKPSAFITPASSEDKDLYAAWAGEQVWESTYRRKKLNGIIRQSVLWTLLCGTGFVKQWWDADSPDYDSGQIGDLCFAPVTPFHVFVPDLLEPELENQPYLIHAQTKSPEWVQARWGQQLYKEINPNVEAAKDILEESFLNLMGTKNQGQKRSVLILELWIKPGNLPDFMDGAVFTIVGDQIVQALQGIPYDHHQYPFAKIDHIPSGKFYADSTILDLIPLQREFNRTRGQIIEAKNRMAKPQLLAERGSVDPKKITSEPGQVILYTPGFQPPQPLPLQSLPSYVVQELDRILADIDDISGQHDVSRGQAPPGVTAATAISYLQEQDESKLSHTFDSLEEALEKIAGQTLSHVVQYWDIQRLVKVTGTDGSFDALVLKGSDIAGNTDVNVEAGSALPTSRAARQAFLMDIMKFGWIDPKKGLELMDIGGVNKLYDQFQRDVREAQRENLRMAKVSAEHLEQHQQIHMEIAQPDPATGMPTNEDYVDPQSGEPIDPPLIVPVNSWNDHFTHIETHDNFRKSQTFEMLPEETKALFEAHVMDHRDSLVQKMMTDPLTALTGQGMDQSNSQQQPPMGPPPMGGQDGGPPPGA